MSSLLIAICIKNKIAVVNNLNSISIKKKKRKRVQESIDSMKRNILFYEILFWLI